MKNCKNCGNAILDPVWGEYKCYVKNRVCVATEKTFGCSDWSEKRAVKIEKVEVPVAGGGAGATFTPHVSEDGTLSWTNDKNLKNPAPVNIRGPQGEPGEGGTVTDEQIKDVLDEYLEENPIEVPEPEVPEMPEIPDKLPNPHKLTFTGAVNAEYDGSKEVKVNIPAGGGGAEWKLLTEGELTEATKTISITSDLEGKAFSANKMRIELLSKTEAEATGYCNAYIQINGGDAYRIVNGLYTGTTIDFWMELDHSPTQMMPMWRGQSYGEVTRVARYMRGDSYAPITSVVFGSQGSLNFGAGTKYRLYYK